MTSGNYARLEDRCVIELNGSDTREFLQGLISNNVDLLSADRAIYAALLSPQGKFLHELFVAQVGDAIWLDTEAERRADLIRRLQMYRLRAEVEITERDDLAVVVVPGNTDAFGLPETAGAADLIESGVALVDPRLAALGTRVMLPAANAADELAARDLGAVDPAVYDSLRLSLGVPDGSRDIRVDKSLLLEANFEDLNGVDFDKGCYVGQENTTRQKRRATVRRRLVRVDVDGPLPAPGTPITRADSQVGEMRSGRDSLGMALLRLDALDGSEPLRADDAVLRPVKPDWALY